MLQEIQDALDDRKSICKALGFDDLVVSIGRRMRGRRREAVGGEEEEDSWTCLVLIDGLRCCCQVEDLVAMASAGLQ